MSSKSRIIALVHRDHSHVVGYDWEQDGQTSFLTTQEVRKLLFHQGAENAKLDGTYHIEIENLATLPQRELCEEHPVLQHLPNMERLQGGSPYRSFQYFEQEDGTYSAQIHLKDAPCYQEPLPYYKGSKVTQVVGICEEYDTCFAQNLLPLVDLNGMEEVIFSVEVEGTCHPVSLKICGGIRDIPFDKWRNQPYLTRVELWDGVESIGERSFSGCHRLRELALPSHLRELGEGALSGTAIKKLKFPEGLRAIPDHCCSGCSGLEEVTLPSTLTQLGRGVFQGTALGQVTIPQGVVELPVDGFANCLALTFVQLPSDLQTIQARGFAHTKVREIALPSTLHTLGEEGFAHCGELKQVTLPTSVHRVGDRAFSDCPKLREIRQFQVPSKRNNTPKSSGFIGESAFANTPLTEFT
ncbi:MAG: leucine-rich repeat domain-containing protein, partial [Eubacteriales bacterium]